MLKQYEYPTLKIVYCILKSNFDVRNALQWPRFMCTVTVLSYIYSFFWGGDITFILKGDVWMSYECFELCEVFRSYS